MIMIIWVYWSIRFHYMFRNSFQCQSIMESIFLTAISLKRPTSLSIINNKVNGSDKRILIQVKTNLERSYQVHSTSLIQMFDCHKVWDFVFLFLKLVTLWKSDRINFVIEKNFSLLKCQTPIGTKCLQFHNSSSFLNWFGIFIRVVNEL